MVAALKALQNAALALPGVRNAEAMAKLLSLAKLDDNDLASNSKVLCSASDKYIYMRVPPVAIYYEDDAMTLQYLYFTQVCQDTGSHFVG